MEWEVLDSFLIAHTGIVRENIRSGTCYGGGSFFFVGCGILFHVADVQLGAPIFFFLNPPTSAGWLEATSAVTIPAENARDAHGSIANRLGQLGAGKRIPLRGQPSGTSQ